LTCPMKSVTSFLRRKGFGIREIEKLLRQLEPTEDRGTLEVGRSGLIHDIISQLQKEPVLAHLADSRDSLEEAGIHPVLEQGHTLKVPVSSKSGKRQLCFTRVAEDRWVYFMDHLP